MKQSRGILLIIILLVILSTFSSCYVPVRSITDSIISVKDSIVAQLKPYIPSLECKHSGGAATCEAAAICEKCGEPYGEALGHKFADVEEKPATCTDDGYTAHQVCERCTHKEGKEVLPAGHTWGEADENGNKVCTACGAVSVSDAAGLTYAISNAADGAVILLQAGNYDEITFITPSTYTVKNLSLIGEEGVVMNGLTFNNWAPVEDSLKIEGLTLKNLTFDSNGLGLNTVEMSNVTVENCKFNNDARIIQGDSTEKVTNLTVKDCEFTGDGDGTTTAIMLENAENVSVIGCKFTNIDFNVMQAGTLAGTVLFDGNTVNGTGDRVFRFVTVSGDMTVSNNTIVSEGDDAGELAKVTNACSIAFVNNTWNGLSDADSAEKFINITVE